MSIPDAWIDEKTGHRLIRLSRLDGESASFYFHNYPFCKDPGDGSGDLMVFRSQTGRGRQFFTVNLKTLELRQVTDLEGDDVRLTEVVARKRREAFYRKGNDIHAVHIDTGKTRRVGTLPEGADGAPATINADESRLVGVWSEGKAPFMEKPRSYWFTAIYEAHLPHHLYTMDVETGACTHVYSENNWLNHLQCSPTDPARLSYCHEGPWHRLHRMWQMNIDDGVPHKIHERTVDMEIAGHEFWSPDGKRIWFDLQIPKGETFYLAGWDIATGEEIRYDIARENWCVHYTIAPDGSFFAGDGGSERSVAKTTEGKWIHVFRPNGDRLDVERIVCLENHDYSLEPNVHFSPDMKWLIFRANIHSSSQVYAVEIDR